MGFFTSLSDTIHTGLDVAGMVPAIGELADLTNAGIYALEGDALNAGISLAACIPIGGQVATGARLATKAGKEVLEAAAEKAAKEGAEKLGKEVLEEGAEKTAKEAAGEAGEVAAKNDGAKVTKGGDGSGVGGNAKRKPRQPNKKKWEENGGTVVDNPDGSTTYATKDGVSVTYGKEGFPDFSQHSVADVKIDPMTGVGNGDFKLANEAAGLPSTPDGFTWHHVEDGTTMQLVPTDVHGSFPHTGGASIARGGGLE